MNRKEYVPYEKTVTVTENRAPTDKSVDLLNQFTDKAKENIIKRIVIDENSLKAVALFYQDDMCMNKVFMHARFILNGKDFEVEVPINRYEWEHGLPNTYYELRSENALRFIYQKISEAITETLMKQCPDFLKHM